MRVTERLFASRLPAAVLAGMVTVGSAAHVCAKTPMTAGVVLEKMPANELSAYISGIVEGLAYARFRKDTVAAGVRNEDGMKCIRDWYYATPDRVLDIEAAFRRYEKYPPWVVMAVLIKKECGE